MAPSPAKKAKTSAKSSSQTNIKDLFARTALKTSSTINQKSKEDEELEWAIQESLREDERRKADNVVNENDFSPEFDENVEQVNNPIDSDGMSTLPLRSSSPFQFLRPDAKPIQKRQKQKFHENAPKDEGPSCSSSKDSITTVSSFAPSMGSTPNTSITTDSNISTSSNSSSTNAFSKLMSTHSEAKEWATADLVEHKNYTGAARSRPQRRTAPFYKVLTGMPISVDGFRFGEIEGCTAYFLSHFHADHYGGMTSIWNHGPVYCSVTTANLVRSSLRVQDQYVCPLPMNETVVIPRTGGVKVTLLDANHCPGSCIFLFEGPQTCHILPTSTGYNHPPLPPPEMTFRYLHCGDFRASPRHVNHPLIKGKRLDIIYLDTTYCNPRYCFPAQEMVVNACAEIVRRAAPEQCRIGQIAKKNDFMAEEEDWRNSPLKGRKLEAFIQAEGERKGAEALQSWLNGKEEDKKCKKEMTNEQDVKVKMEDDDLNEEEEEFGEMDFQDETFQMAEEDDEANLDDNSDETKNNEAQSSRVKQEEVDDKPFIKDIVKVKDESSSSSLFNNHLHVLIVVGTYTIGKEKIVLACAKALGTKIYCVDSRKYRVYAQLEDDELHSLLTRDPLQAYVHVTSLMSINGEALQEHSSKMRAQGMRIDRSIAFRPTGWTYRPPTGMDTVSPSLDRLIQWNQSRTFSASHLNSTRDSTYKYTIFGVPYSEHSSFFELTAFCLSVEYGRIIATVNVGNPNSRGKMARWFDKWKSEKKRRNGEPIESRSEDYF